MELTDLVQSIEKVSQKYAADYAITRDSNWYFLKLQEELGELVQAHLMMSGQARRKQKTDAELQKSVHAEITDVLCHTLLLANHFNVDLEKEIKEKWVSKIS
jgi:NTP pyrophosphatase (non-canonical NTP hydrolase)